MNVTFRATRERDVRHIARDMREQDRIECAAFGHTPAHALRIGLAASTWAETVVIDGKPAGIFGVVTSDVLSGKGLPWFLGTDATMKARRAWAAHAPDIVSRMMSNHNILYGHVAQGNLASRVWLRRLGFREGDQVRVGDADMIHFSMSR